MRYDSTMHSLNDGNFERLAEDLKKTEKPANSPWFCRANYSYEPGQRAV